MVQSSEKSYFLSRKPRQKLSIHNTHPALFFSPEQARELVIRVCSGEEIKKPFEIGIVFVDDETIIKLNRDFLAKEDLTDVISFNLSESQDFLEGEVYVCLSQADRQANLYGVDSDHETSRLLIHGILHLLDYTDDNENERQRMHILENHYLNSDNSVEDTEKRDQLKIIGG